VLDYERFWGLISGLDGGTCIKPAAWAVGCYLDEQTLHCILDLDFFVAPAVDSVLPYVA